MKPSLRNSLAVALICTVSTAGAASVISQSPGLFTPSFRSDANTTYYGWGTGTLGVGGNTVNGTPSINPAALSGNSFLVQATTTDIVASSNNIYSSVAGVNNAQVSLNIATLGTVGSAGFTTIIVQGFGAAGFGFALDTFTFGAINGISPTYEYGINAAGAGQFWAKWEIPGNQASYNVAVNGYSAGAGVLSVTNMIVDTTYSTASYAVDSASAVPEPSMAILGLSGLGLLAHRRRS